MKDLPLSPLSLTEASVIWNAACGFLDQPLALPDGTQVTLSLAAPPGAGGRWWRLQRAHLSVQMHRFDFAGLTGEAFTMEALGALPPALGTEIEAAALRLLLPLWGEDVLAPAESPAGAEVWMQAALAHPGGGQSTLLLAGSQRAFVEALQARALPLAGAPALPEGLAALIEVPCQLETGGLTLPLSRLRSLQPGDCLLAAPRRDHCHLRAGGHRLSADLIEDHWKVTEMTEPRDLPNDVAEAQPGDLTPALSGGAEAASAGPAIDDIPVHLSFVLDRGMLTLAELGALRPGATLPLTPPELAPGLPVEITANGLRIGQGHILEIDGQPAVRIATLFDGQ